MRQEHGWNILPSNVWCNVLKIATTWILKQCIKMCAPLHVIHSVNWSYERKVCLLYVACGIWKYTTLYVICFHLAKKVKVEHTECAVAIVGQYTDLHAAFVNCSIKLVYQMIHTRHCCRLYLNRRRRHLLLPHWNIKCFQGMLIQLTDVIKLEIK